MRERSKFILRSPMDSHLLKYPRGQHLQVREN